MTDLEDPTLSSEIVKNAFDCNIIDNVPLIRTKKCDYSGADDDDAGKEEGETMFLDSIEGLLHHLKDSYNERNENQAKELK